ncbi:MAG TPA: energy transducer TonB [Bryobacteraceae bacterium]|nr:energy transducer TonB [Bryobacteraceae bacterium]
MQSARGPAVSVTIHCAAIALLFLAGANHKVQQALQSTLDRVILAPYLPATGQGGGGGGKSSPFPASRGVLPKIAPRQFTPPAVAIQNTDPTLPMEPTLVIPADVRLPQLDTSALGDPHGVALPPSDGPGKGGGIGDGLGTGIGPGKGPGLGPGDGGDTGGGLRGFAGTFTAPQVLFKVEPEFSEDARKAKLQGVVILYGEVDTDGRLRNIRVTRALGLGLEEKAIEAVKQWRFRPGTRDGKPVAAPASIEVNFHLL